MQPLYATCPSARLHLGEPLSPSLELLLAAARCLCLDSGKVPAPSPSLLSLSLTLSCSLLLSALSFTNTDTQKDTHIQTSDCLCQLFPTSASRHKGPHHRCCCCHRQPPLSLSLLPSHLYWPGCQRLGMLCWTEKGWLLNQIGQIGINMKLMIFYKICQAPKQ